MCCNKASLITGLSFFCLPFLGRSPKLIISSEQNTRIFIISYRFRNFINLQQHFININKKSLLPFIIRYLLIFGEFRVLVLPLMLFGFLHEFSSRNLWDINLICEIRQMVIPCKILFQGRPLVVVPFNRILTGRTACIMLH